MVILVIPIQTGGERRGGGEGEGRQRKVPALTLNVITFLIETKNFTA